MIKSPSIGLFLSNVKRNTEQGLRLSHSHNLSLIKYPMRFQQKKKHIYSFHIALASLHVSF